MNITTINEENNFTTWATTILHELKESSASDSMGVLLFESAELKLWDLTLEPNERMPINLMRFSKGETYSCNCKEKEVIMDMQNVGNEVLKFMIVEEK